MPQPGKRPAPAPPPKKVVLPPSQRRAKVPEVLAPSPAPRTAFPTTPASRELQDTLAAIRSQHDHDSPPQNKREWTRWLRHIAGLAFIADDLERSIAHWHREQFSDLITVDTFHKWASADKWIPQRVERLAKFRESVERQIGTDNVRAFVDDLRRLDSLYDDLVGKIADGPGNRVVTEVVDTITGTKTTTTTTTVPLAFEKRSEAIGALVALDRRRDEKRKGVLGGLPSALGTGGGDQRGEPARATLALSPHVARAMAKAKMLAEREEIEGASNGEAAGGDG